MCIYIYTQYNYICIYQEKAMAAHSSIPWIGSLVRSCPWGSTEMDTTEATQHGSMDQYVYNILCVFIYVNELDQINISLLKYTDKVNRSNHCSAGKQNTNRKEYIIHNYFKGDQIKTIRK